MPFDPIKVRELLRAAPLHSRMPNAEMIAEFAQQLGSAEAEINAKSSDARKAWEETAALQIRHDGEVLAHRKLRESAGSLPVLVAALRAIVKQPKGAAKVAQKALDDAGLGETSTTS